MTTIVLRPMTDAEIAGVVLDGPAAYRAQLAEFGGFVAADARHKSEAAFARLFPEGRPVQGLHLFVAVVGDEVVGHLWLAEPGQFDDADLAYVYDVAVKPEYRGRGYGRAIMQAAERQARRLGAHGLALNVFGGNAVARALYESLGYQTASVQLRKRLSDDS